MSIDFSATLQSCGLWGACAAFAACFLSCLLVGGLESAVEHCSAESWTWNTSTYTPSPRFNLYPFAVCCMCCSIFFSNEHIASLSKTESNKVQRVCFPFLGKFQEWLDCQGKTTGFFCFFPAYLFALILHSCFLSSCFPSCCLVFWISWLSC